MSIWHWYQPAQAAKERAYECLPTEGWTGTRSTIFSIPCCLDWRSWMWCGPLMIRSKSGEVTTSWGNGSWNPIIYKVFIHPNRGWEWDCVHEQYVKICSNFCGADFSWWSGDNHGAMVTCADTYLAPLKLLRNPAEPCISRKHCFGAREDWIHSILFGIKIYLSMNISVLVCIYT